MFDTTVAAYPRDAAPPGSLVLKPVRTARRSTEKRSIDRRAALEFRGEESFHWGDEDGMLLAQFKVAMPGRTENIVNLEHMIDDGAIQSIECPAGGSGLLKVKFAEPVDLHHALDIWEWVNQDPEHHLTVVLGTRDCGSRTLSGADDRIVFDASRLSYDNDGQMIWLDVRQTTWKNIAHTFDLTIGKPPPNTPVGDLRRVRRRGFLDDPLGFVESKVPQVASAVVAAFTEGTAALGSIATSVPGVVPPLDVDKGITVPANAQLSGKTEPFGEDGAGGTVTCKNCSTTGAFNFHVRVQAEKGQMKVASLDMTTSQAFTAQATVRLQVNETTRIPVLNTSVSLFTLEPQGLLIPKILQLGPKYEIGLGIEIAAIAGDLDVTTGGRMTVPASSTLSIDMLSQDNAGFVNAKDWTANFQRDTDSPIALGSKGAEVVTSLRPSVAMVMDILDVASFTAEVFAKTPFVASTFKDIHSSNCSACGEHENGFQGDFALGVSFGARLRAKAGGVIPVPLPVDPITFLNKQIPIGGFCGGSDPAGSACPSIREAKMVTAPANR
ncbi:hypothetical protein QBC47DRAFT_418951 [Echria macrotheca]|uniref:Uncharacterized protein n=1 Tax=Echria macrotheca TaxID=438768 RepID=A0AAJ0B244_9PEZI|nr:hypothetical protein QBC47DRAFT_418951 [Echria macrotheca]